MTVAAIETILFFFCEVQN